MVFVGDAIFQKPPSDCQITIFYLLLGGNKMKKSKKFCSKAFLYVSQGIRNFNLTKINSLIMFHRESGILRVKPRVTASLISLYQT